MADDKIKLNVNGEEKEYFMSFGLQNKILKQFPDVENFITMLIEPNVQERVMLIVLNGREGKSETLDDFEMSASEGEKLLNWINSHVKDFFMRQVDEIMSVNEVMLPRASKLMPTPSGSETSD